MTENEQSLSEHEEQSCFGTGPDTGILFPLGEARGTIRDRTLHAAEWEDEIWVVRGDLTALNQGLVMTTRRPVPSWEFSMSEQVAFEIMRDYRSAMIHEKPCVLRWLGRTFSTGLR